MADDLSWSPKRCRLGIFAALLLTATGAAVAQTVTLTAEAEARCWATHVLQGERVRPGTQTALIAAENSNFWRSQVATDIADEAELEAFLSRVMESTRSQTQGVMQIVFNASACQTVRADIEPGYDPVRQNSGN